MPLPGVVVVVPWVARIVAMVVARLKAATLLEWVAAGGSIASLVDTLMQGDLKRQAGEVITEEVAKRAGLNLDPDDPFSDASLAGAIGEKMGFTLRSVRDRAMIAEDLEAYALGVVAQKTGYTLRSVHDPVIIKADIERIGLALLSQRLGIPVGVLEAGEEIDVATIKQNLLTWAKAELMAEVNAEVAIRANELIGAGNLEQVAASLNSKLAEAGSIENVTGRQIAVRCASQMAATAVADYGKLATSMSKRSRRQLQLRDAQQKFRAKHGNRQKYVPLGMAATIS